VINDNHGIKRPLTGIYTGLCCSRSKANIVVTCDMPFLNPALLENMVKILPSFEAIVPRWPNMQKEPLHAVYSLACIQTMKKHIDTNRYSIIHVLEEMHVLHLNKRGFAEFDPDFYSFLNINDQADNRPGQQDRGGTKEVVGLAHSRPFLLRVFLSDCNPDSKMPVIAKLR